MKRFAIGIISWLPDDDRRPDRERRLLSLLGRCRELFDGIPMTIVAQNWGDFGVNDPSVSVVRHGKLGIVGARETLRKELIKGDFDYAILLDDDAIIHGEDPKGFLSHFDGYDGGYCFRHYRQFNGYLPERYMPACLNLCVISKDMLERYAFDLRLDPEEKVAFEDNAYPILMYVREPQREIPWPIGTLFTSYKSGQGDVRSTWSETTEAPNAWHSLWENNLDVVEYIRQFKEYPNFVQHKRTKRITILRGDEVWIRHRT